MMKIIPTAIVAGTIDGGSMKFDWTPGGGGRTGIRDKSTPGGNREAMLNQRIRE